MCWLSALPLLPWPPDSYRFCCWMVCWRPNEASAPTARTGTACASAFARHPLRPDSRRRCYRFLMSDRRRPYAFTMPHPHGCTNDWRIVRLISSSSWMTAMMCLRTAGRSPWYSGGSFAIWRQACHGARLPRRESAAERCLEKGGSSCAGCPACRQAPRRGSFTERFQPFEFHRRCLRWIGMMLRRAHQRRCRSGNPRVN